MIQSADKPTLLEIVAQIKPTMQCCCDLDNWEPERSTGHSWVCRIHKKAIAMFYGKDEVA